MSDRPGREGPAPRVSRTGPGRFALRIPGPERVLLADLLPQMRELIEVQDPVTRRLFPPAYPDDQDKEREYRAMMASEQVSDRLQALDTVERTLGNDELDLPALEQWMEAVNSIRLVLGTRLDVCEEPPDLEPGDPDLPAYALYEYLGWLMDQMVREMSAELAAG